jgi:hypothetical protein
MLMVAPRRQAIRTLKGWATSVLLEAGAIRECEEHGWITDRADPRARDRALSVARRDPPFGVSPNEAITAMEDFLASISHTCPECTPVRFWFSAAEICRGAERPSVVRHPPHVATATKGRLTNNSAWRSKLNAGTSVGYNGRKSIRSSQGTSTCCGDPQHGYAGRVRRPVGFFVLRPRQSAVLRFLPMFELSQHRFADCS